MIRPIPLFIALLTSMVACRKPPEKKPFQGKEFEGVIVYRVEYDNYPEKSKFGDSLLVYVSHGQMLRITPRQSPELAIKEYFPGIGQKVFINRGGSDTVYFINVSGKTGAILTSMKHLTRTDTRILGHDCEEISFKMLEINGTRVTVDRFYAKNVLSIDPVRFNGWQLDFEDRYFEEAQAQALRTRWQYQSGNGRNTMGVTLTAASIREQKVDTAVFREDTTWAIRYSRR